MTIVFAMFALMAAGWAMIGLLKLVLFLAEQDESRAVPPNPALVQGSVFSEPVKDPARLKLEEAIAALDSRQPGDAAFDYLASIGPNAAPAIPALEAFLRRELESRHCALADCWWKAAEDDKRAIRAIEVLQKIGKASFPALEAVSQALCSEPPCPAVCCAAMRFLVAVSTYFPQPVWKLHEALDCETTEGRAAAQIGFLFIGHPIMGDLYCGPPLTSLTAAVEIMLNHEDREVAAAAVKYLLFAESSEDDAMPGCCRRAMQTGDVEVSVAAYQVIEARNIVEEVVAAIDHPNMAVAARAVAYAGYSTEVQALVRQARESIAQRLRTALRVRAFHENRDYMDAGSIRLGAERLLSALSEELQLISDELLQSARNTLDPGMQRAAVFALSLLGGTVAEKFAGDTAAAVIAMAKGSHSRARADALRALWKVWGFRAMPYIIQGLYDESRRVKGMAVRALQEFPDEVRPHVLQLADIAAEQLEDDRFEAANLLIDTLKLEAVPELQDALGFQRFLLSARGYYEAADSQFREDRQKLRRHKTAREILWRIGGEGAEAVLAALNTEMNELEEEWEADEAAAREQQAFEDERERRNREWLDRPYEPADTEPADDGSTSTYEPSPSSDAPWEPSPSRGLTAYEAGDAG